MKKQQSMENIQKLAKMLDGHQMVTTEEFKSAVSDFINAFAQHRSAFGEISKKNEESMATALQNLQDEFELIRSDVKAKTDEVGMTKEEMKGMMAKCMSDMKDMCDEMESRLPEDGNDGLDADEEKIIQEVLAKIKLPESTVLDTPDEVVDKVNSSSKKIKKERVEGLEQAILNSAANAVSSMPITTMFVNGNRSKNINFTGATVSTTGDTSTVGFTAGSGDVTGPASATDLGVALFNGTTGKIIKNSSSFVQLADGKVGIGTVTPGQTLTLGTTSSTGNYIQVNGDATDTTYLVFSGQRRYPKFELVDTFAGGSTFNMWNLGNQMRFGTDTGTSGNAAWYTNAGSAADVIFNGKIGIGTASATSKIHAVTTLSAATGDEVAYLLNYTTNKATSGNDVGLQLNMTDTLSPGTSYLMEGKVGGNQKFAINQTGTLYIGTLNNVIGTGTLGISIGGGTHTGTEQVTLATIVNTLSSGSAAAVAVKPSWNSGGTTAQTDLLINRTETSLGSGAQLLLDAQVASVSKFKVTNTGVVTTNQIITTNNPITATGNAATIPVTFRTNTVTNNSAATLTITLTTTGAVDRQLVQVIILDASAVAQTITWVNTENSTVTAPVTSNGSTTLPLTVGFQYNNATSKWRCIASA